MSKSAIKKILDDENWIEYYEPKWFTLGQFREMDIGDSIPCYSFHRNYQEYSNMWTNLDSCVVLKPSSMFRLTLVDWVKTGEYEFTIEGYSFDDFEKRELEYNLNKINPSYTWWGPLNCCGRIKHQQVPDHIAIGWRGPIIHQDDVDDNDLVYYKEYDDPYKPLDMSLHDKDITL